MRRQLIAGLVASVALHHGAAQAQAQDVYLLQPGDILRMTVVGTQVTADMPVTVDGTVDVPLAGSITAAGRSLADIAGEVKSKVARTSFPLFGDDGRPVAVQVPETAVAIVVAEYRPVYVDGDVASPGSYPFRPGLTARQAITLAGGFGLSRIVDQNPGLTAAGLRGDLRRYEAQRAASLARIERLRQQIAMPLPDGTTVDETPGGSAPNADGMSMRPTGADATDGQAVMFDHFAQIEDTELDAHRDLRDRDQAYLSQGRDWATTRLDRLHRQMAEETEVLAADQQEFEDVQRLRQTGVVTTSRLSDVRRALLFSSTRKLQTDAEISRTEREFDELTYSVRRRNLDETAEAVRQLQEATLDLAEAETQIAAANEKLLHLGAYRSQLDRPDASSIEVVRGNGETVLGPTTVLRPGDVIRVTIDFDQAFGG